LRDGLPQPVGLRRLARAIGPLVTPGGSPPFPMQPLNFEALYAESLRQRAAQGQGSALANAETAGNA